MIEQPSNPPDAVIGRISMADAVELVFLRVEADGREQWVRDARRATGFPSLRAATKRATRLPEALKAFGMGGRSALAHAHPSGLHAAA